MNANNNKPQVQANIGLQEGFLRKRVCIKISLHLFKVKGAESDTNQYRLCALFWRFLRVIPQNIMNHFGTWMV